MSAEGAEDAPTVDASQAPDTGRVGRANDVPAGEYLLALVWLAIREGERGPYLRYRLEVLRGPHAGDGFFGSLGCDVRKQGTRLRWAAWARACGVPGAFAPNDEGRVRALFLGKPFRAVVTKEWRTGRDERYAVNEIQRYLFRAQPGDSEAWQRWHAEWQQREAEREAERGQRRHHDDNDPGYVDDIPF